MHPDTRKLLHDLSQRSPTFSLSTASKEGVPQSSLLYYAFDDDLNFYFFSKDKTRKSANLEENPQVALLISDIENQSTLQMQGTCQKLTDENEISAGFNLLIKTAGPKLESWPPPIGMVEMGDVVVYRIKITWARLGHFKGNEEDHFIQLIP